MRNGWIDAWGEPPAPEPEEDGPPGYMFPPYIPKQTKILNGCPRCGGVVFFRPRDHAKWCPSCSRAFFPMSEDSVIRPPDRAA